MIWLKGLLVLNGESFKAAAICMRFIFGARDQTSYLHVLDSKISGRDEQSSLLLARFFPSLQQSFIDNDAASVNINKKKVF